VKRTSANDSMLFACESRSLPSYLYKKPRNDRCGVFYCLKPLLHVAEQRTKQSKKKPSDEGWESNLLQNYINY
jgi:hypothetical protein